MMRDAPSVQLLVLVAFERSGVVRRAFAERGHDAWSCDLEPADDGETRRHFRGDALEIIERPGWDLVIAHPPCTYLSVSGLHWNKSRPWRELATREAIEVIRRIWNSRNGRLVIENPVGCINTRLPAMPRPQVIQPYEFGDDASKKTCLWMRGVSPLRPTRYVEPRWIAGRPRWANQTDSGQNRLGPSPDRARLRSQTYPGIASAMADQWGGRAS